MASFSSYLSMSNGSALGGGNNNEALGRLSSGAGDKLKKLQLSSSSKLNNLNNILKNGVNSSDLNGISNNSGQFNNMPNYGDMSTQYEEIVVTIRKSERGFGFELKNGILIVKVLPNSPAFNSGIRVGDIILKINGTCVRTKETHEISNMIHESNSFVSLSLQRKLTQTGPSVDDEAATSNLSSKSNSESTNEDDLKLQNLTNQVNNTSSDIINFIPKLIKESTGNGSDLIDENSENSSDQKNSKTEDLDKTLEKSCNNTPDSKSVLRSDTPEKGTSLNRTKSMNSSTNRAQSSIEKSSDFNSSDSLNSTNKSHKKQYSMSNESFQQKEQQERKLSDMSAMHRRAVKKNRSSNNSKTYQTQSLSNIASSALIHSTSDNELDPLKLKQSHADNDNDLIIAYKDDFSFTSEDNLHESSHDKTSLDLTGFIDYNQLMSKPANVAILLNYLLSGSESPKNLYFCMFVEEFLNSSEKKETLARWAYEIYSTFLMNNAPLKIKSSETHLRKLEEYFEKNASDYIGPLKKLFDEVKSQSIEIVNLQLSKFREVNQMGLANLFQGGGEFLRLYQQNKTDTDQMRGSIVSLFHEYINEITNDIGRISNDWNDSRNQEALVSALISSFCTYIKRYNLPIKHIGKFDIDKIPTFVNKKFKIKKTSGSTVRGHNFVEYLYSSSRPLCFKCKQPFWGIGNQGLICQKSKCEMKLHRSCLSSGINQDCHGSQKKIGTDYKEKLDSFQKILFGSGSKKKEEEAEVAKHMFHGSSSATLPGNTSNFYSNPNFENVTHRESSDYDRQPSIIVSGSGEGFDQRNLPVDIAIRKFEMLNKKPVPAQIVGSPTNTTGNINLARANTINNGSVSPTNTTTLTRFNSLANTTSQSMSSPINENHSGTDNHNNTNHINKREAKDLSNACKRVGSLKVDANKKVKSNIARSKSDPEPDEIKNAQNAISTSNFSYVNDRLSIDSTAMDLNDSLNATYSSSTSQATRASGYQSPSHVGNHSLSYQPSSISQHHLPTSASTSTLTTNSSKESRHSWMNDSDMEVEDELPNLSMHIDKSQFEELSKKEMKVQEIINELIHTEQKHVRNLKIMQHHFYVPIRFELLLTEDDRNLLFPNLEEILELHSGFNNKLKKLRKENSLVDVKQLIEIINGQFQGEQGKRFQNACAMFCQNQSEANKLLQAKMKQTTDKFTMFLNRSENDSICRKLHLKDFLPTEVQRLVKYRLLFHELTKNTPNVEDQQKLAECVDASSKISQYVNKAVTECENRKRVIEIQQRLDSKDFDQYCTKSPLLQPYKNLNLTVRKLVYESELDWKISNINTVKLTALLFEDILVFLEKVRTESSNDEKRRYILRPLIYSISKQKQMFTPVIPLSWINSCRPLQHDKRSFHIVAIIEEAAKALDKHVSKPIQTQMLFILIAKSGDERSKWITYLQELTGKTLQISSIDMTSPPSTPSLTSTTSLAYLSTEANPTLRHNSVSTSTLITKSDFTIESKQKGLNKSNSTITHNNDNFLFNDLDGKKKDEPKTLTSSDLRSQIAASTNSILAELTHRHQLLVNLLKLEAPEVNLTEDTSLLFTNSSNLIENSIGLLNTLSTNLNSIDTKKLAPAELASQIQNTKLLLKLEDSLNKFQQESSSGANKLPSLILPTSEIGASDRAHPVIGSDVTHMNRNRHSFVTYRNSEPNTATTVDLSEDEQINYYDDEDIDEDDIEENSKNSESNLKVIKILKPNSSDVSDVSDDKRAENHSDDDDGASEDLNEEDDIEHEENDEENNDDVNDDVDRRNDENHFENARKTGTTELTISEEKSYSEFIKNQIIDSTSTLKQLMKPEIVPTTTTMTAVDPKSDFSSSSSCASSSSEPVIAIPPKLPTSPPPTLFTVETHNDSSDDEVKDYLTLKDSNYDEYSHV